MLRGARRAALLAEFGGGLAWIWLLEFGATKGIWMRLEPPQNAAPHVALALPAGAWPCAASAVTMRTGVDPAPWAKPRLRAEFGTRSSAKPVPRARSDDRQCWDLPPVRTP
jgi:hypothetical protein